VIASEQLVTALATSLLPTLAVVIGIVVNDLRLKGLTRAVDARFVQIDGRLGDVNRHIEDFKDEPLTQLSRMGQVIDARLKRLEERLRP
jgi:hypothetical protein